MKQDSPAVLLREQAVESAQMAARIRKLLVKHVNELQHTMESPLSSARARSEAAAELMEIMKSMNDAVYKAAPFLMQRGAAGSEGVPVPSAADVMEEMVKGKKAK